MSKWSQKCELHRLERRMERETVTALYQSGKTAHWAGNRWRKMNSRIKRAKANWGFTNQLSY